MTKWTAMLGLPILMISSTLGCAYVEAVGGERRLAGDCPWEFCSDATPNGLIFYGQQLFDDSADDEESRLGPVAAGGVFTVTFTAPGGEMPDYRVEFEGQAEILGRHANLFTFRALEAGPITANLVHAHNGYMLDAVTVQAASVVDVILQEAKQGRVELIAGCHEWVGIGVQTDTGRAFDLELELFVDGESALEFWDCYSIDVPLDVDELQFVVRVAGQDQTITVPVVQGTCPDAAE